MLTLLLRSERGSALVIFAFVVPLILILGTLAVDTGNWFTHKRHLQTQADAAALSGATKFALPCDGTTNTNVATAARQYAGPSATGNTGPYNPQVSNTASSQLHIVLNADNYYGQGNDTEFGATWGQPCTNGYIDVKATEKDLPWFFNWIGSGIVPTINAEARARFTPAIGEKGFLPLGLPLPVIYKATATIRVCGTGQTVATIPLVQIAPDPTLPGLQLWGPAAGTFTMTKPNFSQCSGDHMTLDTNIEVSGSPNVVPGIGNCGTKFVDCYQTTQTRVWKPGSPSSPSSEQDPPGFRNVNLTAVACDPGTAYWASGATSNIPCKASGSAQVDWGTLPSLYQGFHEVLIADAGGGQSDLGGGNPDGCAQAGTNTCAIAGTLKGSDGTNGTENVTISWTYWWTGAPNNSKCKAQGSTKCKGSTVVHGLNADDQSTVARVYLSFQDNCGAYQGLQLDSISYDCLGTNGGGSTTAGIVVGTENGFQVGQRAVIRQGISQGNQSLVCDPDYTQGKTFQMFVDGCKPLYGINNLDGTVGGFPPSGNPTAPPGNPPLVWEPCPGSGSFFFYPQTGSTSTWYCIPTEPGLRPSQVSDGVAARTGNCDKIQNNSCSKTACNYKNNWQPGVSYDTTLGPGDPGYDPRVIKIYLIPVGALNQSNGNDVVEVVSFAGFYVTGWNANGANSDPCKGVSGLNPEDIPTGKGAIAGRFIKIVDPPNGVPNPNASCDPTSVVPCTTVLVR